MVSVKGMRPAPVSSYFAACVMLDIFSARVTRMLVTRTLSVLPSAARSAPSWLKLANRFVLLILALLSGCASEHYTLNQRLEAPKSERAYAMRNLQRQGNSDSLLVLVSLSGGGYRAAAMGYGVLQALRETQIDWESTRKTMLDEVDFISGVSGGSLTAAYYLLYGDQLFSRFESDVLQFDMQTALMSHTLSPRGLWRQTSKRFGRSDLLQEVLDERIFHGKTFGDASRNRPMAIINATDMEFGGRFEFTQDQFDHICSDLDSVPISRAVAASMAVPLALSPITLWNYNRDCPLSSSPLPLKSEAENSRYIHLLDAALADNSGIQTALELISVRGGIIRSAKAAGLSGIKKRVFIIVNAQGKSMFDDDSRPDTPSLWRQLRALGDVPIDRYSTASIQLLKQEVARWRTDLQAATDEQLAGIIDRNTDFFVIEVSLIAPPSGVDVSKLRAIPTALSLSDESSKELQSYAKKALFSHPEWQRLLKALHSELEN